MSSKSMSGSIRSMVDGVLYGIEKARRFVLVDVVFAVEEFRRKKKKGQKMSQEGSLYTKRKGERTLKKQSRVRIIPKSQLLIKIK